MNLRARAHSCIEVVWLHACAHLALKVSLVGLDVYDRAAMGGAMANAG
jgi:hypothetical protein